MIKEMKQVSMAEAKKILGSLGDSEKKKQVETFIKKFSKIKLDDAESLRKDLEALNLIKLKPENIVKIIETLPEDAQDLNRVFVDISLDEDETNRILETIKKYQ